MPRRHAVSTGCALAIATLTLSTVPAAAEGRPASIPTASTTASAFEPPPGMLEALVRDLKISMTQARARLLNETRLTPIATQLSRTLGSRFAGAWLRGDSAHTLVVATTSDADIPRILDAGAQAEVVARSLTELTAIKRKLDQALPSKPQRATDYPVSSVRYVDVKRNKVVVLAPHLEQTRIVVEGAGVDTDAVLVLPSTEIPQPLYDLVGGDAYYIGTTSRCSIGFPVVKGAVNGFVTAGHCGAAGATTTGFNRVTQGVFQGSSFPGNDYAWVAVNSSWTPKPAVDNGQGGTVPVAGARVAIEGASVCRSGSTTDWHCGLIQQRDASVTYPQGTVTQLTRTNVCAEPGDSGGSFISVDQAQGVTSGGSGDCTSGGTTYFQPIGEILTAYGLTLKTTTATSTCTGYPSTVTGSLANGQYAYQPPGSYYWSNTSGVHSACLDGPNGADFDLYLQKWNGQTWRTVASSDGPGPDEKITYTGTAGYYSYLVNSASGSGPYSLGYRKP
ncbi:S1 family peptidase [Nonomuraea cavernae]|uniref:Serine protease n=1 Tax=Nonomuraea cavernae TaxID=2045107 RepID=A0A917ZA21_9ACTN|nr:S1 family peptidase [Nonomuraea cavernae]MCA2186391.1 S1 family peptidase [Nonomuraea cavernae]GGO79265.1 serine protease [Nonomuraea cavernae]